MNSLNCFINSLKIPLTMNKRTILINIKDLIGTQEEKQVYSDFNDMNALNTISNAYLIIDQDKIIDFGQMKDLNLESDSSIELIDVKNKSVLPCWNDSHTHLVFAGTREQEFVDRINGLSYQEIAHKGGGILNSAKKLANTSFSELYDSAAKRLEKVMKMGTGAIEIKSGYGLSLENEIKMLKVAAKLKENYSIPIKTTFLGAHAVPEAYRGNKKGYVDNIINEMIPNIAKEKLADYIDVFCETNYFSVEDMHAILDTGKKHQLKPKVHVNQFTSIGGIQKAIEFNALTVDHLEVLTQKDIDSLKEARTIPTLLPSCSLFINIPYANGKTLLENNIPFALASDYNPGSTPCGNMNLVISLACINMKINPEAAINAATIMGAAAMELENQLGTIKKGKLANIILTEEISSYNFIPYSFGENNIERVMIKGNWV